MTAQQVAPSPLRRFVCSLASAVAAVPSHLSLQEVCVIELPIIIHIHTGSLSTSVPRCTVVGYACLGIQPKLVREGIAATDSRAVEALRSALFRGAMSTEVVERSGRTTSDG